MLGLWKASLAIDLELLSSFFSLSLGENHNEAEYSMSGLTAVRNQ